MEIIYRLHQYIVHNNNNYDTKSAHSFMRSKGVGAGARMVRALLKLEHGYFELIGQLGRL